MTLPLPQLTAKGRSAQSGYLARQTKEATIQTDYTRIITHLTVHPNTWHLLMLCMYCMWVFLVSCTQQKNSLSTEAREGGRLLLWKKRSSSCSRAFKCVGNSDTQTLCVSVIDSVTDDLEQVDEKVSNVHVGVKGASYNSKDKV